MTSWDATRGECLVFTYKEGLLSAVAHDLKLRIGKFTANLDGQKLTAQFDARSLTVVSAMKEGVDRPSLLAPRDHQKIERTIVDEVLQAARFPEIEFSAVIPDGDRASFDGTLKLHGVTRAVRVSVAGRVAEVELNQPDFGIKPYSAMLGTLKVKPRVLVRVTLPVPP